jgi:tetraacyldisaccharide-1-P 4'-kinase
VALCAIAQPERFVQTIESLGAEVCEIRHFPDHAPISKESLNAREVIVTTEKDAVRIGTAPANVFALSIALEDVD